MGKTVKRAGERISEDMACIRKALEKGGVREASGQWVMRTL